MVTAVPSGRTALGTGLDRLDAETASSSLA